MPALWIISVYAARWISFFSRRIRTRSTRCFAQSHIGYFDLLPSTSRSPELGFFIHLSTLIAFRFDSTILIFLYHFSASTLSKTLFIFSLIQLLHLTSFSKNIWITLSHFTFIFIIIFFFFLCIFFFFFFFIFFFFCFFIFVFNEWFSGLFHVQHNVIIAAFNQFVMGFVHFSGRNDPVMQWTWTEKTVGSQNASIAPFDSNMRRCWVFVGAIWQSQHC